MNRVRSIVCVLALLLSAASAGAQSNFYLKNGDRVVFYGDSITEQRLYTTFVETFVATRFPKLNLFFVHSGVGGDRVSGGWAGAIDPRLDRDVIAYRPTVVTCMLGMNDASYQPFKSEIFNAYTTGYQHIIERLKAYSPTLRATLIQPSPFDDVTRPATFEGGYNSVLLRYSQFVKELAEKSGYDVADLNNPVKATLERANAADANTAKKIIADRVHPGPSGHLIMAGALLKAWNAPAVVTRVEIDAAKKQTIQEVNTKVKGLALSGDALVWEQRDEALPFPLGAPQKLVSNQEVPVLALTLQSSDFVEALNQEVLKVAGLTGGRYRLKIDGEEIGVFTKEQLAEGVNLATMPTPMTTQALAVHALTSRHNDLHQVRWRQVQMPLAQESMAETQTALAAIDKLDEAIVKKRRAIAIPKPHKYELSPL